MLRRVLPLLCQKSRTSKKYFNRDYIINNRDYIINKYVIIPAVFGGFYCGTWLLIFGLKKISHPQEKQ